MKYTIQDKANQVSRRNGAKYRYSPFALFINEGNYYMLAADLSGKKLYHFRVDRMKAVDLVCEERTGKDLYKNIISTKVEVSFQFYSWLCRFGTQVKIISPQEAVDGFTEYLQNIANSYKVDESC